MILIPFHFQICPLPYLLLLQVVTLQQTLQLSYVTGLTHSLPVAVTSEFRKRKTTSRTREKKVLLKQESGVRENKNESTFRYSNAFQ